MEITSVLSDSGHVYYELLLVTDTTGNVLLDTVIKGKSDGLEQWNVETMKSDSNNLPLLLNREEVGPSAKDQELDDLKAVLEGKIHLLCQPGFLEKRNGGLNGEMDFLNRIDCFVPGQAWGTEVNSLNGKSILNMINSAGAKLKRNLDIMMI